MSTKVCKTCQQIKPIDQYYSSKTNAGGRVPNCKSCMLLSVNKEVVKQASKRYRDRNPDKRRERDRLWRERNNSDIKVRRRLYLNAKYKNNPKYRLEAILRQQVVDYIKYGKSSRTAQLLGYSVDHFITIHGVGKEGEHLDHKIPKSWFKEDTPVHVVWHIQNLQWLDATENMQKYNRYMTLVDVDFLPIAKPHIKEEFLHLIQVNQ